MDSSLNANKEWRLALMGGKGSADAFRPGGLPAVTEKKRKLEEEVGDRLPQSKPTYFTWKQTLL